MNYEKTVQFLSSKRPFSLSPLQQLTPTSIYWTATVSEQQLFHANDANDMRRVQYSESDIVKMIVGHKRGAGDLSKNLKVKRTTDLYMEIFSISWLEALS